MKKNNRSYSVCFDLGWIDSNGRLTTKSENIYKVYTSNTPSLK